MDRKALMTANLKNLETLADSLVEARKTRLGSKDPYITAALSAMCLWVFIVEIRSSSATAVNHVEEFNKFVPLWIHQVGAACLLAAFLAHVLQIFTELDPFRRNLLFLVAFINGVSGSFYTLSCLNLVPVTVGWNGVYVVPLRFLHWCMTSPVMIYILSHLADVSNAQALRMIALTSGTVLMGLIGSLDYPSLPFIVRPVVNYSFLLGSNLLCGVLFYEVHQVFRGARDHLKALITPQLTGERSARQALIRDHTLRSLYAQEAFFYLAWALIPVAYYLTLFRRVDTFMSEVLFTAGDLLAKVLFANVALSSNYLAVDATLELSKMAEMESIEQKEAFMSRVSHELRTPLNGIIGLSENILLNPGALEQKHLKFLSTIKNSGHQLLSLINDILDTAAYKKGKIVIQHQQVNLEEVIANTVDMLRNQAKPGVVLEHEFLTPLPLIVGDNMRIARILNNLVANALRNTHRGAVTITAEALKGALVRIEVRDTGNGISPDRLATLFESEAGAGTSDGGGSSGGGFREGNTATTAGQVGGMNRLGLSMTKRLVEAHHGTIVVASELGVGSVFTVMLPCRQPGFASDGGAL